METRARRHTDPAPYQGWHEAVASGTHGFGNMQGTLGSTADPLGFGAQSGYRDEHDCHLLLSGARSWDTTTGRFLTRDTDLGQAPYAYCDGDPVNFSDPSGHKKQDPPQNQPPMVPPAPGGGSGGQSGDGDPYSGDFLPGEDPLSGGTSGSGGGGTGGSSTASSGTGGVTLTPTLTATNNSSGVITLGFGGVLTFGNGYKFSATYTLNGKDGQLTGNQFQGTLTFPPIKF